VYYVPKPIDRSGEYGASPPLMLLEVAGKRTGLLDAFFCGRCGFVEYYLKSPGSIPTDGDHVQRVTPGIDGGLVRSFVLVLLEPITEDRMKVCVRTLRRFCHLSPAQAAEQLGSPGPIVTADAVTVGRLRELEKALRELGCIVRIDGSPVGLSPPQ
jgi:hypothetical protein